MSNARNIAQIRKLNYNSEEIGMGFNSDTGLAIGTCLDFTPPTGTASQEAESDVTIIMSHEDLMSKLHMSSELEGRYALSSASVKVDYANSTDYNSSSTFIVARLVISNTINRGRDFRLKPEFQNLLNTDPDGFSKAFGDSFVRALYRGGEFYCVMRITSVDSKTQSNLAVTLQADVQSGLASGQFKGDLEKANQSENTKSEFTARFYQKGGAGENEIGTTLDVDEIKRRLHSFPDAVINHAFPYFIEVATYDTVPLPTPTKEQQQDFLLALSDADSKKLQYIQARNDCDFAAQNPQYFSAPPAADTLRAMSAIYTQLTNAVILHGLGVAKGDIPPTLFDPSKLSPPLSEPVLVLRKRDVGLESSFTDFWVNKDKPETRKADHDLALDIGTLAQSDLNNFSAIRDPGGDPLKTARLQGDALSRSIANFREYDWNHGGAFSGARQPLDSLSALPLMLPKTIQILKFAQNAIVNTKGLDQFTALTSLDLSHNSLASIGELSSLTALRELLLVDNNIADLAPLGNCTSLEMLDISGNSIADLTPLASLKNLQNLTLFGTFLSVNGAARPSGNPISNALALADIPGMANPFTVGNVLSVRYGTLSDGPAAQFTGTATRIGKSVAFRMHLTCGAQTIDDVWTLRTILAVTPKLVDDLKLFYPAAGAADIPAGGSYLAIHRDSVASMLQLNVSFVDQANPKTCGIDVNAYPTFATKIKIPTFDATVVS